MGVPDEGFLAIRRWRLVVALVGLMLLAGGFAAQAARAETGPGSVTVNTTSDSPNDSGACSLRKAILYANGTSEVDCTHSATATPPAQGVTIVAPAQSSHYIVNGAANPPLTITGNAAINGGGRSGSSTTTIDAGGSSEVISIGAAAAVTLSNLAVTGGLSGFDSNTPPDGLNGGGISNAGTLTLNSVTVSTNKTRDGAACGAPCTGGNGGNGGGIYNTGTLTINNSTITGNSTGNGADGQFNGSPTTSPGGNGGFSGQGGGIYNSNATLTITNSTISGNSTGNGGAGGLGSFNFNLCLCQVGGNGGFGGGAGSGGGIYVTGSNPTVTITGSTISGNLTGTGGAGGSGGFGFAGTGAGQGGSSGGSGGGLETSESSTITNTTIVGNQTGPGGNGGSGGNGQQPPGQAGEWAGFEQFGKSANVSFTTIADNHSAGSFGGLFAQFSSTITIGNSIIAGNTAGTTNPNCGANGVITDAGNNVYFGDTTGCPAPGANSVVADPKLAPALADNGGTVATLGIQTGSAAIDRVPTNNCPVSTDERTIGRPQGPRCDSGAYEYAPPAIAGAAGHAINTSSGGVTATITPNLSSRDTTVTVRYGTTAFYGSSTAAQAVPRAGGPAPYSTSLTALRPGTTYHFQIVATNGDGTTVTPDATFTTTPPTTATLIRTATLGATATLTIVCSAGNPGDTCSGPITLTSHVTTISGNTVAVTSKAKRKPKKHKPKPKRVTKNVTVGKGSYVVATGRLVTVKITLNSTGQKLLAQRYTLPTTLSVGGTTAVSKRVTFNYSVIRSPISFTWTFSPTATVAQNLSVTGIPSGGKVTVICHGGGCPFGKRTFSSRNGRVSLTSSLRHNNLRPGATLELDITASNQVGKVAIFTMRSGQQPRLSEECLPPGAGRPSRCV